jgi:hypothetical protein
VVTQVEQRTMQDKDAVDVQVVFLHSVHQSYMPLGILTADAAGRAKMEAGFFGLVAASWAHFVDGFWAASDTARAKIAAGFFAAANAVSEAHFANGFWRNAIVAKFADGLFAADAASRAKFADGIWENAKIADSTLLAGKMAYQPVMDAGEFSSFAAHFTGALGIGDTLQIDLAAADIWQAIAGPSVPAARQFQAGISAAADLASFVAAINDAASPSVARAIDGGGNTGLVFASSGGALNGVYTPVGAPAMVIAQTKPAVAASDKTVARGRYTLDAGGTDTGRLAAGDEILLGVFQGAAGLTPQLMLRCATAGGAEKSLITTVASLRLYATDNRYAVCLADGLAVLANSDVVSWVAIY